jgi:hypothetical protein
VQDQQRFRPREPVLESGIYAAMSNTGVIGQFTLPAGTHFPPQKIAAVEPVWYEPVGLYQLTSN